MQNASEANCESIPNPEGKIWLPNDVCTGGPPMCVPAAGCCAEPDIDQPSGFLCTDDIPLDECEEAGDVWTFDTDCSQVPECQAPTGCCNTDPSQVDTCTPAITEAACLAFGDDFEAWNENTPCDQDRCASDVVGCCPNLLIDPTECTIETQTDCGDAVMIQPGLMCNDQNTCGPLGCCQADGSCSITIRDDCSDPDTWIEADMCTQSGVCSSLVAGCCQTSPDTCNTSPPPPTGDCDLINFVEGDSCLTDGTCGELEAGCCQFDGSCSDTTNTGDCNPDNFFVGDTCMDTGFCEPLGCCFLDGNGEAAEAANRGIDPEKCIETTDTICGEMGGSFQGPGTDCAEFPEECAFPPPPTRNVPTIGQWGMIAMAGLLGIFSLFIIMRRHRYNVS